MKRALVLLIALRMIAGWRTFLRSGRGSPIALLGKLLILSMLLVSAGFWAMVIWLTLTTRQNNDLQFILREWGDQIIHLVPLPILAVVLFFCIFAVFQKPFVFNPTEENFLVGGPFHRRQLLNYKIGADVCGMVIMAMMATPIGAAGAPIPSAFFGTLMLLIFFELVSQIACLVGSLSGLNGPGSTRRLLLALAVCGAAFLALRHYVGNTVENAYAFLRWANDAPILWTALAPIRWFVEAALARRVWPDLVKWGALCLAVNGILLATVYALDSYLQRRDGDADLVGANRAEGPGTERASRIRERWGFPLFSRCSGAGPIAWRQMMVVLRKPEQIGFALTMYAFSLLVFFMLTRTDNELLFMPGPGGRSMINPIGARIVGVLAVMLPMFIAMGLSFDFRGDMGNMDVLKALPISPIALTAGQLFVPVAIAAAMQWLALLLMAIAFRSVSASFWVAAAFVPPVSVSVMAIENLPIFWFPSRQRPGAPPEPFEAIGHVVLHPLLRMLLDLAILAITLIVSTAAYFLSGQRVSPAILAAWLTLSALGAGLVALLARVFDTFDVTRDAPA